MTAFRISHIGLGDSLLHAAQQLPEQDLAKFLISWRNELRNELSTDKSGFLCRRFPSLANSVHNNFPDICVIYQYVKPATSWRNGGGGLDTSVWLHLHPRLSELAALCERASPGAWLSSTTLLVRMFGMGVACDAWCRFQRCESFLFHDY